MSNNTLEHPAIFRSYKTLLVSIHAHLLPRTYVEIGCATGGTLALALPGTHTVGVDPVPRLHFPMRWVQTFDMTSDEFFARDDLAEVLRGSVDLAFIDGFHNFEFALRDFMNLEVWSSRGSTILVHDCLPMSAKAAQRDRTTGMWSGDVWKVIPCLRKHRPDLSVSVVDVRPAGLGIVTGLDPASTALKNAYDDILDEYVPMPYAVLKGNEQQILDPVDATWSSVRPLLPVLGVRAGDRLALRRRHARRILRARIAGGLRHPMSRAPVRKALRRLRGR